MTQPGDTLLTTTEYQATILDPSLGEGNQVQCANCGAWRPSNRLYCPVCGARNIVNPDSFLSEADVVNRAREDALKATVREPAKDRMKWYVLGGSGAILLLSAFWFVLQTRAPQSELARAESAASNQASAQPLASAAASAAMTSSVVPAAKASAADAPGIAASEATAVVSAAALSPVPPASAATANSVDLTVATVTAGAPAAAPPVSAPSSAVPTNLNAAGFDSSTGVVRRDAIKRETTAKKSATPASVAASPSEPVKVAAGATPQLKAETPYERLQRAVAACGKEGTFLARNACEFEARTRYCPPLEGKVRECPFLMGQ
jgi:hypothetical protein